MIKTKAFLNRFLISEILPIVVLVLYMFTLVTINENTKGAFYSFLSDELFFKTKSQVSSPDLLIATEQLLGFGYFINDNIQV